MTTTEDNNKKGEPFSEPLQLERLSDQATSELLQLLLQRGYLHKGVDPIPADPQRGKPGDPNDEDHQNKSSINDLKVYDVDDPECNVVFLLSDDASSGNGKMACCTYPVLESKLKQQLENEGGRCGMKRLVQQLNLSDEKPLLRILKNETNNETLAGLRPFQIGDDIVSSLYLDRISEHIFNAILKNEALTEKKTTGFAVVSDLASQIFHLPMDITLKAIQERVPREGIQLLHLETGAGIASSGHIQDYRATVLEKFQTLQHPVTIADICHDNHWDTGLVAQWVQDACNQGQLQADLHTGSSLSIGAAMYTPHAHVEAQRQAVDELFGAQGYMTAARGVALGVSKSKMGEFIQESFPSAIIVSETLVVSQEAVLNPLGAVLQEAIATDYMVDLQNHVPADILEQEEDARLLLSSFVIPAIEKQVNYAATSDTKKSKKKKVSTAPSIGVVVLSSEGGMFVSVGMVQKIQQSCLPGLVEAHAKQRAEEIDKNDDADESEAPAKSKSSKKKGGRKSKKASKADLSEMDGDSSKESKDIVPLLQVVKAMMIEYPELSEIDPKMKERLDSENRIPLQLDWEKTTSSTTNSSSTDSISECLSCEFCRTALYTPDLIAKCEQAVQLEVKRLQSARMSKASVSRKEAATKVRNVETAFEDYFVSACYLLQTQHKFLQYVESSDSMGDNEAHMALVDKLTEYMLSGCCADFTNRLTQYCLFKNEISINTFQYITTKGKQENEDSDSGSELPWFCTELDVAMQRFPPTYLSLSDTADADIAQTSKDPLPKLREILPGSLGVALARQWVMCGGRCYQGGTKTDESGVEFVRRGDLEKFMTHIEENCLSLCGMPFKKIDKKSEKQFLFARRQRLLTLLEGAAADDASIVLDLTIQLLFQQVRNVVAFGSDRTLLKILTAERKIGEEVSELLLSMSESLKQSKEVDPGLITKVKACGLARDISKHVIV